MRLAEQTIEPRTHLIAVAGELDSYGGNRLIERISDMRVGYGHRLILDLTDMSFMDSGGLRGVLDAWLAVTTGHADFTLVVPRPGRARRVFEMTGKLDLLDVAGSREQALTE